MGGRWGGDGVVWGEPHTPPHSPEACICLQKESNCCCSSSVITRLRA